MKDLKKVLIVSALILSVVLFVSAVASAANPVVTIAAGYSKRVSVVMEQLASPTSVWVVNEDGIVLLEEKTTGAKFAKMFNLELLPAGEYKVIVNMERKEIIQPVTLQENAVVINENKREEFFSPYIKVREDAIDVMLFNGRLTDVSVAIFDEQGSAVYEDTMQNVLKVEKRYSLNDLARGSYTVRVSTSHKDYYQAVAVK